MKTIVQTAILIWLFLHSDLHAQSGTLDEGFGDEGVVTYRDVSYRSEIRSIMLLDGGNIITSGHRQNGFGSQLQMLGYHPNGLINESFGGDNLFGNPTWGYPGIVNTDFSQLEWEHVTSSTMQADGKIVVGGYAGINFDFLVARYKADGSVDSTFNTIGYFSIDEGGFEKIESVAITPNNQILVSGTANNQIVVMRYLENGSTDNNFGIDGRITIGSQGLNGGHMALDESGKIYVCGTFSSGGNYHNVVARIHENGILDMSFGSGGIAEIPVNEFPSSLIKIALHPSGKPIIVANDLSNMGNNSGLWISRLNVNGSLDMGFGNQGIATKAVGDFISPHDFTIQHNGKIIITGRLADQGVSDVFVAKFYGNGEIDTDFGTNGIAISGNATDLNSNSAHGYAVRLQPDGNILVGGFLKEVGIHKTALWRFNNQVDSTYSSTSSDTIPQNQLKTYPNPFSNSITITFNAGQWNKLQLIEINGRTIFESKIDRSQEKIVIDQITTINTILCCRLIGPSGFQSTMIIQHPDQ